MFMTLYVLALYAGFLIPIPSALTAWILALRGWVKREETSPVRNWRRLASKASLLLCTAGVALWIYVVIGNGSVWTMNVGMGGSLFAIVAAALSSGRLRFWLLVCAIGLFCFFGAFGGGEAI